MESRMGDNGKLAARRGRKARTPRWMRRVRLPNNKWPDTKSGAQAPLRKTDSPLLPRPPSRGLDRSGLFLPWRAEPGTLASNAPSKGAEETVIKSKMLAAGLVLGLGMLGAANASAEERGSKLDAPRRAAAFIQKAGSLIGPLACNAHRALKLCADSQTTAFNFGMKKAKASPKPAANKLFQIAQMFIDDMKVAEIGDWKVALKVEIE